MLAININYRSTWMYRTSMPRNLIFSLILFFVSLSAFGQGGATFFEITGETNPTVGDTEVYTLSATPSGTISWSVGAAGTILSSTQTTCTVQWTVASLSSVEAEEAGSGFLPVTLSVNVAPSTGNGGGSPGSGGSVLFALNYARTYALKKPSQTTYDQVTALTSTADVTQTTAYFGGLGRAKQTVVKKATPDDMDFVSDTQYDAYGRVALQYLPYESSTNTGTYKSGTLDRESFYNSFYPGEDNEYSTVVFETSPLNRPVKVTGVGEDWYTNNKAVETTYRLNTSSEGVFMFNGTQKTGTFGSNKLSVVETNDEDGKRMLQYTNERGQVILKKVQDASSPGTNHSGWLSTYYVYDKYQRLIYVIPPKAVKALSEGSTTQTLASAVVNGLCFQYTYDNRGRMITKRVPGSDNVTEMVYDKSSRMVLTRDANQIAKGEWTFTKYDALSRPVLTGVYNSTSSRSTLQSQMDAATSVDVTSALAVTASSTISGDYLWLDKHVAGTTLYQAKTAIELLPGFETTSATVEISTSAPSNRNYIMGFYDESLPKLRDTDRIESVTYYDNYEFTDNTFSSSYNSTMTLGTYLETPTAVTQVQGKATGGKVRVFGTDDWLEAVSFYDKKSRLIQSQSVNHKGGLDITTNTYDFSGKTLYTYSHHQNPESADYTELRVLKKFSYDHADRLTKVESRNVGIETGFTTLAENTYNEISQLATKQLGNGHQTLNYDYNIRGWLKELNDVASIGSDYFAMELNYASAGHYNGNIGSSRWRSSGNTDLKKYTYSYDKSNRIKSAIYTNQTSSARNGEFNVDNIGYDANGNISSLRRYGRVLNAAQIIDNLAYTYTANSNMLSKVDDSEGNAGIGDFTDGNTGTDYSYDANGNMTADANKDITAISYNRLNLPEQITFTGGRSINFLYDAAGIKLQKTVNDNGDIKTTDYIGGFIYQGNKLQHYAHEEGRVRQNDQGNLVYDYYIKDHLGNTRVTFTTEANTVNVYKATMESENDTDGNNIAAFEEQYFYNLDESRSSSVSAANQSTTGDDGCTDCDEAAITNGQTQPIGPAIILDVMPGDEVDLEVWAYNQAGISSSTSRISSTALVSGLVNAFVPNGAGTELINQTTAEFNAVSGYLTGGGGSGSTTPFAFLNYIVFDSDFDRVSQGHQRVSSTIGAKHLLTLNNINITQKGYIYIWVSNESNHATQNTFFDDLRVIHTKGHILQEDHYYPFGGSITALSSTAPLSKPNRFKFNGKEEQTEFNLSWHDYGARNYDAQLGRWFNIDPMSELYENISPYTYAMNNPVRYIDPNGMAVTETDTSIVYTGQDAQDMFSQLQATYGKGDSDSGDEAFVGAPLLAVSLAPEVAPVATPWISRAFGWFGLLFTLTGDSGPDYYSPQYAEKEINKLLEQGNVVRLREYVDEYNKRNIDKIVFRYLAAKEGMFVGKSMVIDNVDRNLKLTRKYITPDFYSSRTTAKSRLALPYAPQMGVWAFESDIQGTKHPQIGWNIVQPVNRPDWREPGGGREGTISQPFPVRGAFILGN